MNSFTEDLTEEFHNFSTGLQAVEIYSRSPPYFREIFRSLHQNSQHTSPWSLMSRNDGKEVIAHYGCNNTSGLKRSLGSYISSFLTDKFETQRDLYKVWDYIDVGLILISEVTIPTKNRSLYVANPVSKECVEIPCHAHLKQYSWPLGIAILTENDVLLGYKVVLLDFDYYRNRSMNLTFLIYSSETGLWSLKTVHSPFSLSCQYFLNSFSLKGSIHWHGLKNDTEEVVVSMDFYADGMEYDQYRVTSFPDSGKHFGFERVCRISCGFIMYMNIVSGSPSPIASHSTKAST